MEEESLVKKEKKNDSFIKKFFRFLGRLPGMIRLILILLVIGIIFYLGYTISKSNLVVDAKATQFGLRNTGELVTQTGYVTVLNDTTEDKDFFDLFKIPFTTSRIIFSYDFTVDASIKFEEIELDVDNFKREVTVKLPHAKHYKTTMIIDSQHVYLDEKGLFTRIDLEEQNEALRRMEAEAFETAKNNGLLEKADENGKKIIESMLKSDPLLSEYNINFKYTD